MLRDLDQPLGQIEDLALLHPRLHRRGKPGAAAAADVGRMPLDPIGGFDLFERSPLCPFCPPLRFPERPRRLPGTRGFFFSPSLEGGFELLELFNSNCR